MNTIFDKIKRDSDFVAICDKYLAQELVGSVKKFFVQSLEDNHLQLAKLCLKYIGNFNFGNSHELDPKNFLQSINPLIRMCYLGNLSAVQFLVENGANIEHLSNNCTTAIMYAFQNGYIPTVCYLLEKGAKIIFGTKRMTDFAAPEHTAKYLQLINIYDKTVKNLQEELVETNKLLEKERVSVAASVNLNEKSINEARQDVKEMLQNKGLVADDPMTKLVDSISDKLVGVDSSNKNIMQNFFGIAQNLANEMKQDLENNPIKFQNSMDTISKIFQEEAKN